MPHKYNLKNLKLTIEKDSLNAEFSQNIIKNYTNYTTVNSIEALDYQNYKKTDLLLAQHKGAFIKPCPATPNYNCCNLNIFHFALGCTINCRYCILEAYLGSEALVFFSNVEKGLQELQEILKKPAQERPKRFCTGEFTDSLLLDKQSGFAQKIMEIFYQKEEAYLELKTKTTNIEHLLNLKHSGNIIFSFSVNSPSICKSEEALAAPLEERLKMAKKASEHGFPIALHFDPLIIHENWAANYLETAEMIGHYLKNSKIVWLSLGCFRYLPKLKEIMLKKYPQSKIYNGEFIKGDDGKMRYPRPVRLQIYKTLIKALKENILKETVIYFCMESPKVWQDVFGFNPQTEGLSQMLDAAIKKFQ